MYFDQVDCGNRVRRVRTALGYTQENVAEQLNISHSHYCNFEKGKRMLSIDALIELAALLHARLFEEAFYSGAGKDPTKQEPEPQTEAAQAADVSPDTATLLKILQNPEMAALLKTLAKSL